ncbi:MAG TPA: hypothetical protein V6D14_01395 [Coleofasciculaceae cyanobacterium]|jgi:hypothetical protein
MKTEEATHSSNSEPNLAKKPAFQYVLSVSIGVFLIVLLAASAYYGIFRF